MHLVLFLLLAASPVEPLARAYRQNATAANRSALASFAAQHPGDTDGALALLALAGADLDADRDAAADIVDLLRPLAQQNLEDREVGEAEP